MTELNDNQIEVNGAMKRASGWGGTILYYLASLRFALGVVFLIALACITGTLIPQGSQVEQYLERHPGGQGWIKVADTLGFTHVFYSWWFIALLFLLATSLVVCTQRRFMTMIQTTGAVRVRVAGSFISHVSLLLIFAGGVVRAVWSEKGVIGFREGEAVSHISGSDQPMHLPFEIRLDKFELEHYATPSASGKGQMDLLLARWTGSREETAIPVELQAGDTLIPAGGASPESPALHVTVERILPDFIVDTGTGEARSRSEQPNNPAIQLAVSGGGHTNRMWVFARFPDMTTPVGGQDGGPVPLQFRYIVNPARMAAAVEGAPIKAYKSTVEIIEGGKSVLTNTIAVNSPLAYGGFTFYQLSYNPEDLHWTLLQVVRDPSVPIVYGGFLLMMIGLTIVFCVGPYLDDQRKKRSGAVS